MSNLNMPVKYCKDENDNEFSPVVYQESMFDDDGNRLDPVPRKMFAKAYDPTKTYPTENLFCIQDNKYYKFTGSGTTTGAFDDTKWTETDDATELTALNSTLATKLIAREIPSNKFTWDTNWFKATNFDLSGMTVLGFIVKPLNGSAIMNAYLASSTDLRVIGWVPSNGTNITSAYTFVCWAIGYATA